MQQEAWKTWERVRKTEGERQKAERQSSSVR